MIVSVGLFNTLLFPQSFDILLYTIPEQNNILKILVQMNGYSLTITQHKLLFCFAISIQLDSEETPI